MKGIFTGDFHYGLHVEELDRTQEISEVADSLVDYAVENKVDFVSIGGDLTHTNVPHPDVIALLIQLFNKLEANEIYTFVLKGNHDAVVDIERHWGLTPLEKVEYEYINFIKEPEMIDLGGQQFLFLPHVTRSQIVGTEFNSVQEYLDHTCEELLNDAKGKVIAVTHYNVDGAVCGTEEFMLRQHDLRLPGVLQRSPKVMKIFNSHIHTAQEYGNKVVMPGSIVCTDFGDLNPKSFVVADIEEGKKIEFGRILTNMIPMMEATLSLFGDKSLKEFQKEYKQLLQDVTSNMILKVRFEVAEERQAELDFDKYKKELADSVYFLKSFDKKILHKRSVRDKEQKPELSPIEAVKRYLNVRKPEGSNRKLLLAKKIIEDGSAAKPRDTETVFESSSAAMDVMDKTMESIDTEITVPKSVRERLAIQQVSLEDIEI